MSEINVAIIGAGYWGKNLIRNCQSSQRVNLSAVCDSRESALNFVKTNYPAIKAVSRVEDALNDSNIHAILIATPTASHYELAKAALLSGKHVFVEKPMTETAGQAMELVNLAKEKNLILHVDHTFVYTGAVRKIKDLISKGELGDLRYFDSERLNLGLIQPDVNVIYDLAVHDLSILNYIFNEEPETVSAFANSYVTRQRERAVEESAHINLRYPSGFMAHIHASWLSPVKFRKMLIGGSKKMIVYNDIEPSEKIKVYDHGVDLDFSKETPDDPIYRSGDVLIPNLDRSEALLSEINHFADCVRDGKDTVTNGYDGYKVVKILEACSKSLKYGGQLIIL